MRVSRLSVFLITALMACATAREKKIVCYFSNWAIYRPGYGAFDVSRITPELCTHLVYSYAGLDPDGTVKSLDPNADLPTNGGRDGFNKFNGLRQRNPAVKTFLAIGGWSQGSSVFSAVAADYRKRAWFVNSAVNFARAHGFDGLSLDWQYPNQRGGNYADRENYVLLVKDLRLALDRNGMLLMATVGAAHSSASLSYKIREMSEWLDTINLMTYDFHGSWDSTTGINSPLYSAAGENNLLNVYETVKWWLNQGAPAHKLVVAIPAYGRSFELKYMWDHAIGSPVVGSGQAGKYTSQPGFLGHNEILELLDGSTSEFDWTRIAAYAYYNKQWFSYENTVTITQKTKMIKELGLGGAMLYSIDTDDFLGNSGRSYPLLKDVNNGLLGYVPPTSSGVEPGTVDPYQCECQVVNEFLRDLYDCNVYYQCIQDIGSSLAKKKFRCQPQLVFDLTLNVCNWPNQVDCSYCRRPRKFSPDAIKNETTATIMSSF